MKNITKMPNTFLFFFLILFLLSFRSLYADTVSSQHNNHDLEQKAKPKLSFAERAIHAISTTRESYKSSWLKIKDHLQELRMKLSSPDLEPPTKEAAEKIKESVKTSSQAGMDASEGWAKSTAEGVGNAADKTTDKLKISDKEESKSEL